MAKVISLSGPQGGGKTTLLNGLKTEGIIVDDFKVSREVQTQLGWDSLENVLKDPKTMMQFQVKVRDVKYGRELENQLRTDAEIILTERSFADIAAYTILWARELVDAKKWDRDEAAEFLLDYVYTCGDDQEVYHGNILLPSMPHVAWQADPHRAKQQHIQFITEQLDHFFDLMHPGTVPVFRITEGSVSGRIEQTQQWIETLGD